MEEVEGYTHCAFSRSSRSIILGLMHNQDEDLRPSNDPGRYVCDFIYYTSMVEYWRLDHKSVRPVMFLHVPEKSTDEDVARGKKVALGLIEALVSSRQRA